MLKLAPVFAKDFIRKGIGTVKPMAELRGIRIRHSLTIDLPCVMGDTTRLERVVAQLVGYAVRRSGDGGSVRVTAARDAARGRLTVTVSDPGTEVQARIRNELFERTSRGEGRRPAGISADLDLHFCRLVIENHGGEIFLPDGSRKGSASSFSIPG